MADPTQEDPTQAVDDIPAPDTQAPDAPDLSQLMMSVSPDRTAPQNPATYAPPPSNAPPRQGRPILMDLIQGLIKPPSQIDTSTGTTLMRPESRVDTLENFLTNFVGALGTGMANSGHGPGANLRGAGAAIQAPYQQAVQQYQLGQTAQENQARLQQQQAQTQLTQAQTAATGPAAQAKLASLTPQPRFDPTTGKPLGLMTDAGFTAYTKGQGAAATNSAAKITTEQFKAQLEAGKVARVEDAKDPQTGQLGKMAYAADGSALGFLPGALPTASLLSKTSSSQQYLQTSPGVWQLVSKTSTTTPNVGGAAPTSGAPATPASGFPRRGAGAPNVGGGAASATPPNSRIITGNGPIIAFDPVMKERVLTTPTEAQQKGYTQPVSVTENNIEKYRNSAVMFNDVQANVSRFRTAAQDFATQGSPSDAIGINLALNESKIGGGIHLGPAGVEIPGYSSLAEAADRVSRSASYKSLSPAGKNLVDGYFRTMAAVPAYQKALTNIGKSNKEMMDLELANIPNPTMAPADILRKLDAFQENINQGVSGLPRIAGIPNIRDVREKFETPRPVDFDIPQPFTGNPFSGNMQGSKQ